jgi:dimethylargininase
MTTFTHAIVRKPGPNLGEGITTAGLGRPCYERALEQHACYVQALQEAGLQLTVLDPLDDFPDGHFVEDVAVVTPEIAVIARPGTEARRGEADAIEPLLRGFRDTVAIASPGTLDGGDVLIADRRVYIGLSSRTNSEGATQIAEILEQYGYQCMQIPVDAALHLKSSVNYISADTLLVTRRFTNWKWGEHSVGEQDAWSPLRLLIVDEGDEYAANSLWINDRMLMPLGFPRVREKLETLERSIVELDVGEMQKMDGGLTCMSLRF